jgi:serine/threonine protein kinase
LFIELDLMQGGDLYSDIKRRRNSGEFYTELEVRMILKCILQGLEHIHKEDIVHRDIKPANLLLKSHQSYDKIKIGDFGLSGQYEKNSIQKSLSRNVGTVLFMAPE